MKQKPDDINHFFQGAFSIDMALFSFRDGDIYILLTLKEVLDTRKLGLPGNLIDPEQDTDEAMDALMRSKIGTDRFYKKQLQAFSRVDRHPQGRVISFAYYGLVRQADIDPKINAQLHWYKLDEIPDLAYDHNAMIKMVLKRFRKGLLRHPIVFELIAEEFIISDIIKVYGAVFNKKIDGSNFRKQIVKSKVLIPLNKKRHEPGRNGRPSEIYRFDRAAYKGTKDQVSFNF